MSFILHFYLEILLVVFEFTLVVIGSAVVTSLAVALQHFFEVRSKSEDSEESFIFFFCLHRLLQSSLRSFLLLKSVQFRFLAE